MDDTQIQTQLTKWCNRCRNQKSVAEFQKQTASSDGLYPVCRDCKREVAAAHYQRNKEKVNAKSKAYYLANPARHAAKSAKASAIRESGRQCISEGFTIDSTVPFYAERRRLIEETGKFHRVIHVVPLKEGGMHCASNLKVVTAVGD